NPLSCVISPSRYCFRGRSRTEQAKAEFAEGKELVKNRVEKICGGEDTVWRGRRHATWHAERRGLGLSCSALRLRICTSPNDTVLHNMKTNRSFSTPAQAGWSRGAHPEGEELAQCCLPRVRRHTGG